jgi:rhodanese-related sulfurtransferase
MIKFTIISSLLFACSVIGCQQKTTNVSDNLTEGNQAAQKVTTVTKQVAPYKNVAVDEFMAILSNTENAVLLDVRTPEEIAQGKIDNAIELDFYGENFQDQLKALDSSKTYFIYCRSGSRSANTAAMLNQMGCNKVYNMEGGYSAYSKKK